MPCSQRLSNLKAHPFGVPRASGERVTFFFFCARKVTKKKNTPDAAPPAAVRETRPRFARRTSVYVREHARIVRASLRAIPSGFRRGEREPEDQEQRSLTMSRP